MTFNQDVDIADGGIIIFNGEIELCDEGIITFSEDVDIVEKASSFPTNTPIFPPKAS